MKKKSKKVFIVVLGICAVVIYLPCAFYGKYYVYLCAFIPMREFLYVVNVFILMILYYG